MTKLTQLLDDAVARADAPFLVAMVADHDGVLWEHSAGPASATSTAGPETLFRSFSMSKAIGGAAAMILVDRGLLTLDTPVASLLPEFAGLQVLDRMGPDGPVLRPPRRQATIRHLLTHTAGLAYEGWNPKQAVWQLVTGAPHPVTGTLVSMQSPLMFDPGEDWSYGIGHDWLSLVIERVDGRRVDHFCGEEIFGPLEMTETTFEPERGRLGDLRLRCPDGGLTDFEISPPSHPEVYGLGQAIYTTAPDYVRFLRLVLNNGELAGRKVISADGMRPLLENQIGHLSMPVMRSIAPLMSADVDLCPGARKTWTAGFMRNEDDMPGMRKAGSLGWAGFLNTHYWIDPESDVAAVFMTQSLPFCDPRLMNVYADFERCVYDELEVLRTRTRRDGAVERPGLISS